MVIYWNMGLSIVRQAATGNGCDNDVWGMGSLGLRCRCFLVLVHASL
jgi:hypothetical protein